MKLMMSHPSTLPAHHLKTFWFGLVAAAALWSCSASSPEFPVTERAPYSRHVPSDSWLGLSQAAADRKDWAEAGMWLDRHATLQDAVLDHDFWQRRALYADQAGDPFRAAEVRQFLLQENPADLWLRVDLADDLQQIGRDLEAIEVLEYPFPDLDDRVFALSGTVELMLQGDRQADAALRCEELADLTEGTAARDWWQRASSLHERLGNLSRATVCLQRALEGMRLNEGEERGVQRLEALQLGRPQNVSDALLLLRHHTDPAKRISAIEYLSEQEFAQDVGTFEFALRDPEVGVVRIALEQMGRRAGVGRCEAILPLLDREDAELVLQAVRVLGLIGTSTELGALLNAMIPEDRARFRAAREAMRSISGQRFSSELDPGLEERRALLSQWTDWFAAYQAGTLEG